MSGVSEYAALLTAQIKPSYPLVLVRRHKKTSKPKQRHNTIDGKQHSNIKVVVNDSTHLSSVPQTNQKLLISDASSSYVSFTAITGKTVTIDYTSLKSGSYNNVFIDDLSLDVLDPTMLATDPYPENRDKS